MSTVFPTNENELRHIFRDSPGHVGDTPENRQMILEVANDPASRLESDQYGNRWAAKLLPNGEQIWVRMRDEKIINAGINSAPRNFNSQTGLNRP